MAADLHDLSSFIASGNTQPGGFAGFKLNLPEPEPADEPRQPKAPLFGEGTMRLFHEFVEDSVHRNREAEPPAPPPPPPIQPGEWRITGDLMNQKWGTVLKTLQPTAATGNGGGSVPPLLTRPRQAPAFLGGKAFTPRDGGVTPRVNNAPMITPRAPGILRSRPVLQ